MNTKITENWNDYALKINRGENFKETTQAVSNYIQLLDLPAGKNDHLIKLLLDNLTAAQKDAFVQGLKIGTEFSKQQ